VLDWVSLTFHRFAVAFDDLYTWLSAVFSWSNILKTKNEIVRLFDVAVPIVRTGIGSVGQPIVADIDNLYAEFKAAIAKWRAELRMTDTSIRTASNRGQDSPAAAAGSGVQGGWMTSKLADHAGGSSFEQGGSSSHDPADAALVALMAADRDSVRTSIEAFFRELIAEPGRFVALSLDGLLGVLEALADLVVRAIKAAVTSATAGATEAFDLFVALVRHRIDVPFISTLYRNHVSDADLTIIDLVALVVAVPATLIAGVLHDAPVAVVAAASSPASGGLDLQTEMDILYVSSLATLYSFSNAGVDAPVVEPTVALFFATFFCVSAYVLQMLSVPGSNPDYGRRLWQALHGSDFRDKTPLRYETDIWFFQWFQWVVDVGIYFSVASRGKVKRTAAPWSQVLDSVLGGVHCLMFINLWKVETAAQLPHALPKFLELIAFGVQELPRGLRAIPVLQTPYVYWALSAIDLAGTETSAGIHADRTLAPQHPDIMPA